ncbi:MAG: hypothetical protein IKK34_07100 [Clostridia bacterium]|nr:hypothetical protein [Clostridia bacterium]
MIDNVQRALTTFWSQFTSGGEAVPAYLQGLVPSHVPLPYITMQMSMGDALQTTPMVAQVWVKHAEGDSTAAANAQRAEILNQIAEALPSTGVRLPCEPGFLMLRRSSGDFITLMLDADDPSIYGGRIGYEVTYYNMI